MFDRGSPLDGQHDRRSPQQPSQRYLRGARSVCLRDSVQHLAGNFACSQWEPGNKGKSSSVTIVHHSSPIHGRQSYSGSARKPIGTILRARTMCSSVTLDNPIKRILPSFRSCARVSNRRLKRDNGVRNMQLINVDAIHAHSLEASFNRLAQVRGSCIVGSTDSGQDGFQPPLVAIKHHRGKETALRQSVPRLRVGRRNPRYR